MDVSYLSLDAQRLKWMTACVSGDMAHLSPDRSSNSRRHRANATDGLDNSPKAERLVFSDGSRLVNHGIVAPKTTTGTHKHTVGVYDVRTMKLSPRVIDDAHEAELVGATSDIDAFEGRFPTLPGDAEEREELAVMNRTAALQALVPLLDTNEDGFIDRTEMQRAMPAMPDEDLSRTMKECDLDGDGRVAADEWVAYVLAKQANKDDAAFVQGVTDLCFCLEAPFRQAVAATFKAADLDNSGQLNAFEASKALGRKALDKGIKWEDILAKFDTSQDGLIDEEEFEAMFRMMIDEGIISRPRYPREGPSE